ncbi:MAG: ribonuclease P protein component [Muribaculum sp.]|nr:ribonuclease P protein component [Muribaculum sp.]
MENVRFTLPKSRKLRHKTLLDAVFEQGDKITTFPLRLMWRPLNEKQLADTFRQHVPEGIGRVQIMISVPKRKLRHAVDRVAMRRRIRESFRLHQHMLDEILARNPQIRTVSMAFVYMAPEKMEMNYISARMHRMLEKFVNDMSSKQTIAEENL